MRLREALSSVQLALDENEARLAAFQQQFARFSCLWQTDMQAALADFLAAAGSGQQAPPLDAFAAEMAKYKAMQEEVQALPASAAIGWIKVDAKPLKQALLTRTSKWIYLFMRHLHSQVGTLRLGWTCALMWGPDPAAPQQRFSPCISSPPWPFLQVEGSTQELYAFMGSANATLDESLDSSPSSLASVSSMGSGSLPPSLRATPRGLPSVEARVVVCAAVVACAHLSGRRCICRAAACT